MTDEEEQEETTNLLDSRRTVNVNMEARQDHQLAKRFKFLHGITVVIGLLMVVLLLEWVLQFLGGVAWTENPSVQFNWHPILMSIGMIFLYGQSILLYRAARGFRKRPLKLLHASMHFIVFILVVIGLKAVFDSHNLAKPPTANLYTLHSWVGLIAVIIFTCQLLAGFISFLFPGLPLDLRAAYLHVHTSFGTAAFVFAITAAMMGLNEKAIWAIKDYQTTGPQAVLVNCIGILLVCFGALVLYLVNDSSYKRIPLPEDEMPLSPTQPETAE